MKINYKVPENFRIYGVDERAFNMVGVLGLIKNYKVVCSYEDRFLEYVDDDDYMVVRESKSVHKTSTIISRFVKNLRSKKVEDKILTFQAEKDDQELCEKLGIDYLNNEWTLRRKAENKYKIRNIFPHKELFPKFELIEFNKVWSLKKLYEKFKRKYGIFVMQHETLSGGEGTFIIKNKAGFKSACKFLKKKKTKKIVISKFIAGTVASAQCCVTQFGVFSTGVQEQIFGNKYLSNTKIKGSELFSGGVIGYLDLSEKMKRNAYEVITKMGEFLGSLGYKGIFGVDIIISRNKVYLIEVNPRLTGLTPLITMLQREIDEIPLILFHILEHLGIDYKLKDFDCSEYFEKKRKCSYLLLHNTRRIPLRVSKKLRDGVYKIKAGNLVFVRKGFNLGHLEDYREFLILQTPRVGKVIKPGERTLRIISRRDLTHSQRVLRKLTQSINGALFKK